VTLNQITLELVVDQLDALIKGKAYAIKGQGKQRKWQGNIKPQLEKHLTEERLLKSLPDP